jgi:acetyl esterase/lipase
MSGQKRTRWVWILVLVVVFVAGIGLWLAARTPTGKAAFNVLEYRVRVFWEQRFGNRTLVPGSGGALAGTVQDVHGEPISGAVVVVSTSKGVAHSTHSDAVGTYHLQDVPPGRYAVAAGKWGYDNGLHHRAMQERTLVSVRADRLASGVDIVLEMHEPWQPTIDEPPVIGPPQVGYALFPAEVAASRVPVTFTNEGLVITTTLIYESLAQVGSVPLPVVVASYPSAPIDWDRVSVALANEGYVVLATGPSPERGLDIPGMGRDMLKAVAYLADGQLTPRADPERQGWVGGSYSGLILYQALREAPEWADALILVGSITDGFLWVGSLYDETLEIPDWHETAVASLGRPDRMPEFYLMHSPAFFPKHLPPALVVHTTADEIVPYNQSLRLDEALTAAQAVHELFIYEDTSHYLDQINITPETAELYRRMSVWLDTYVRQSSD